MKQIISKSDVAKAIENLKDSGKKSTIAAIHAALGNKGSLSTVVKLKAEIEADAIAQGDSAEGLKAFRELWALAIEEGRKQKEAEAEEMRQALDALSAENQKLDGQVAGANNRIAEVEKQRDGLVSDLAKANERVAATRATADQNANKLADALERIGALQASHAKELASLRQQLASAEKQAHAFELKLARTEARLEK
jgi:chromosome segregation ATPase